MKSRYLRKGFPREGYCGVEGRLFDVFDDLEHGDELCRSIGFDRRQGQGAIACHDGRHAVFKGRRGEAIPAQLGVEVGVNIDEARRDNLACRVNNPCRPEIDSGRVADATVPNANVAHSRCGACAVNDRATSDQCIAHLLPPLVLAHSRLHSSWL
jgi:hypothetical protein